jgi:hypothetical protein
MFRTTGATRCYVTRGYTISWYKMNTVVNGRYRMNPYSYYSWLLLAPVASVAS